MESDTRSKGNIVKKTIKILLKILYQVAVIMCLIITIIIVLQKVTSNNRTILGYRIFRVITGSMEPEYDIGQVVICKETNPEEIKIGDDIVYFGKYGEYSGKIIMHEVIGIDKDENNNFNFHAKGLHTASMEDPLIKPNQIYGVVKFKSGILTILYNLATSIYSSFIIVTLLVLNVFISFKFTGKNNIQQLQEAYEDDEDDDENVSEYDIGEDYIEENEINEEEIENDNTEE